MTSVNKRERKPVWGPKLMCWACGETKRLGELPCTKDKKKLAFRCMFLSIVITLRTLTLPTIQHIETKL